MTKSHKQFPNQRILERLKKAIEDADAMATDRQTGLRDVARVLEEANVDFGVMKELSEGLTRMLGETQGKVAAGHGHILEAVDLSNALQFSHALKEMATVIMLEEVYFQEDPTAQAASLEASDPDVMQQAFTSLLENNDGQTLVKVVVAALRAMNTPAGRPLLRQIMYNCPEGIRAFLQMYESMSLIGTVNADKESE